MLESIIDPIQSLAGESYILLGLAALAAFAVIYTALKIAVKLAIRIGLIAAVVLAGLYTVGYVG